MLFKGRNIVKYAISRYGYTRDGGRRGTAGCMPGALSSAKSSLPKKSL